MLYKFSILCGCLCLIIGWGKAQDNLIGVDADEMFKNAQELIFKGYPDKGQELLLQILTYSVDYHDARICLARCYAWNKEFGLARTELKVVLSKLPTNSEAMYAIVDVEMWAGQYLEALIRVTEALTLYPNVPELLFKRAVILFKLGRIEPALEVINNLLVLAPDHEQGIELRNEIRNGQMKFTGSVSFGMDFFGRRSGHATYTAVQLSRMNSWGSAFVRLNYASRYNTHGFQPEVDLYPKIARGVYAYLNYGFSQNELFSRHRLGVELYGKLSRRLEISAGLRHLAFVNGNNVQIYTGSLGLYLKDCWISYRPYITPGSSGVSFASAFLIRRYFLDADNYVGITGGFGFSPDERRTQSGTALTSDAILLKSNNVGLVWQKTFYRNFMINIVYAAMRQELAIDPGKHVWTNGSQIALKKKF